MHRADRLHFSPSPLRVAMSKLALITLCLFGTSAVSAQTLEVKPARVLVDKQAVIRAKGLQPHERVTIAAHLVDGGGQLWQSQAEFIADADGIVDTSKQSPSKGSYDAVSAMGLVWSMMPKAKHVNSYESSRELGPQLVDFSLLESGKPVANAQLQQIMVGDDVHRVIVKGRPHGVLFAPGASGPHPAVLVVGGSEGGAPLAKAAWLASHGFAAFALGYFRYEDLPADLSDIPLEYFGQALAWMMQRPEIDPERIAIVGTSRGGELALQLGSMYPQIKAVVAYVPADVRYPACCGNTRVPYAWTWKGQPLAFAPPRSVLTSEIRMRAAIPVENTRGPVLLIGAEDDGIWRSSEMAEAVADRLHRAQFAYQVEVLKYAHAGHRAGRPEIVPTWHAVTRHPVSGRQIDLGGSAHGDAESTLDAIPKVLNFLNQALSNTEELKHNCMMRETPVSPP
jgi:dienelactone hydrolase